MTSEAIILSKTTSFLVSSHFYVNGSVEYNSFFRYFHISDGLTLHQALTEKISYSGNKSYHSNKYDQFLPSYTIFKIQ